MVKASKILEKMARNPKANWLSEEDGGGFMGLVPDLQGCISDGETREEALANTQEAMSEWIAHQAERGLDLPQAGNCH